MINEEAGTEPRYIIEYQAITSPTFNAKVIGFSPEDVASEIHLPSNLLVGFYSTEIKVSVPGDRN
jgi:hypothetical protein